MKAVDLTSIGVRMRGFECGEKKRAKLLRKRGIVYVVGLTELSVQYIGNAAQRVL